MKLLAFSDIHGNLPAAEAMLKHAGKVDGYISLGDIVNYGPWSNECVDLITSLPNIVLLRGNHEEFYLAGKYGGTNEVAKAFFDFCYPSFDRFNKIKNFKDRYELNGFTFQHTIEGRNIYPDSEVKLDKNYVIGHSHHQFKLSQSPFVLYNVGSVGQNRKYINVINYMILETDTMDFESHELIYNVEPVIQTMRDRRYPKLCIDYYDSKERKS